MTARHGLKKFHQIRTAVCSVPAYIVTIMADNVAKEIDKMNIGDSKDDVSIL